MNESIWIIFSLLAALFSGITSVFAKVGVKEVDSVLATAIRTTIILVFSAVIALFMKSFNDINLNFKTIIFLILSGITTFFLWISYFKALQLGDVNKVTPVDKTSIVITLILSYIFLKEKITYLEVTSIVLILSGTFLMTTKSNENNDKRWIIYAVLTALFASLATILSKIGLKDIDSNLASLIRTLIVFIIIWIVVLIKSKHKDISLINKKSWMYIFLSGLSTALSWLCYFKALQKGEASTVFTIEKLSIVVAIVFSWIFLKEKITVKTVIGLVLIVTGTILLMFK